MKWLRFPRTLGIVACLYLVGMSAAFGMLSSENYEFLHNSSKVEGTITALIPRAPVGSAREVDRRLTSTAPTVRYVVAGKTYEHTAAHGRFHQPRKIGDSITVLYDPADPAVARIRGEGRVLIPVITGVFALAAILVAFILIKTRHLRLEQDQLRLRLEQDQPRL